jgi:hypothetical protein
MVGVVGSSPIVPTRIPQPDQILMLIRLFVGMNSGVSSSFVLLHARRIQACIPLAQAPLIYFQSTLLAAISDAQSSGGWPRSSMR